MKKILLLFLIVISLNSFGQTNPPGFTPVSANYSWLRGNFRMGFALPKDTFAVTGLMQGYPWVAEVGDFVYRWSTTLLIWVKMGDAGSLVWGDIGGVLSNQTDLQTALDAKEDLIPSGLSTEFVRGDKTLAVFEDEVLNISEPLYLHLDDVRDSVIEIGDDRYKRKYILDLPLQEYTLGGDTIALRVRYWDPLWNARQLMNYNLPTTPPENGAYPSFDEASGEFVWAYPSIPMSMSSPSASSFASYKEDDIKKVLKKMYEIIKDQGKEIDDIKKKLK